MHSSFYHISTLLRHRQHLRGDLLLDSMQLTYPLIQPLREFANLLPRQHTRLYPRYLRLLVYLVQ